MKTDEIINSDIVAESTVGVSEHQWFLVLFIKAIHLAGEGGAEVSGLIIIIVAGTGGDDWVRRTLSDEVGEVVRQLRIQ